MARSQKTVFRGFAYQQCDSFATFLSEMARQGWHFKEWGLGLVFAKGKPEDSIYAVEVFTDGSEYDTRPEPKTKEFAEYCEAAGWALVDAKRKFCIFKQIRPDAVPILTSRERLENIAKATQPSVLSSVGLGLAWTFMRWSDFNLSFSSHIFHSPSLLITAVWSILLVLALLRCGQFYLWKYRCRKKLEQGEELVFGKGINALAAGWYGWLYGFVILVMVAGMILMGQTAIVVTFLLTMGATVLMGALIAKFRPDALNNQIIQIIGSVLIVFGVLVFGMFMVFSESDGEPDGFQPPLVYADIGAEAREPEIRSLENHESVFGSWLYCNLDYGTDYFFYDIYESEYGWVLDQIWEDETDGKANEIRSDCTEDWGADLAFRNGAGNYLVRYGDRILILCPSMEDPLTREQIEIIRDKFKLR